MEKILTISIAAYNVEKYIENALNSLICDNMDKLEVIIENDGSKDKTSELAKSFVEKYPNTFVLVDKQNGGYGSTINESLKRATGKYFKQLDGDDWYNTKVLDEFIDKLEALECDCVYSPYYECFEHNNTEVLSDLENIEEGMYSIDDLINERKIMQMHCLTFKTELLKRINMQILEHCFYTDQEFIIYPLIHTKDVYVTKNPIYMYRLGIEGQSVSKAGYINHCNDHKRVVLQILEHYDEIMNCSDKVKTRLLNHLNILINIQYKIYLWAKNKKTELIEFDEILKTKHANMHQNYFKIAEKYIKVLILSKFSLYKLISNYSLNKK